VTIFLAACGDAPLQGTSAPQHCRRAGGDGGVGAAIACGSAAITKRLTIFAALRAIVSAAGLAAQDIASGYDVTTADVVLMESCSHVITRLKQTMTPQSQWPERGSISRESVGHQLCGEAKFPLASFI